MASLSSEFKIQEYVFHEVLGQGTFGITYRCTDEGLHSTVAVKEYFLKGYTQRQDDGTLTPAIESDDSSFGQGLEMFCREAQTLERLKHPNIVNVRRVFKHNGTAYIVMDYYSGSDLQAWLEEHPEPLSEVEAFTLLEPVFDALHYIHQKGFVHRDIKPSNILMHDPSEGGPLEPILLDFGAARDFLAPSDPRTVAIFTEGYAPIEQYSKHAERGPFTDIYACGALFYHLVTGEQPPSALDRAQGEILSFEAFSGSVAPVIAQAMASNANERYQSMDEFLDALQSGLSAAQLGAPQLIFPEAVVDTRVRTQLEIQAPAARSIVITAPRNGAIRGDNAAAFAVTSELPLNIGAGERASLELQCIPREEDLLRAQSSNDSGHQGGLNDPSGLAQEALQQTSPQADTQGQDSNSQDSNPQETDTQHIKTATKTAINISKEEPPHTTSQTATDMLSFSDSASLKPGAGTDDGVTATVVAQPSDTNVSPETDVPDTDHLQATEAATERLNDHARLTLRAQMYLISSDPERPKLFYELVAPVLPAPELATAVAASSRERPWRALFGRRSTAQIPARASTLNATERPAAAKLGPAGWNRRAWLNVMMAFGVVLLLGLGLWYGLTRRGEPEPVLVASIAELSRQLTDAPEGSIVRLAAGEYLLDKPLVTEGSIRVVGAGAERTRLVARGAFPAWRHMRGTLSLEALSLEGIGADPSRTQANLLELDSGGLSLLQSRLVGAPGAGVWLAAEVG
ncbi:MAG: serine/threonine-protein kinase, partial [Deinococcota bacterium]